jgi:hypothetical protein
MKAYEIILQQLGGNRFVAMTGANSFCYDTDNTLIFKFRGSKKFNGCRITLNGLDLYDMRFVKIGRAPTFKKVVEDVENVYCDQLQSIFTDKTGLYTTF